MCANVVEDVGQCPNLKQVRASPLVMPLPNLRGLICVFFAQNKLLPQEMKEGKHTSRLASTSRKHSRVP